MLLPGKSNGIYSLEGECETPPAMETTPWTGVGLRNVGQANNCVGGSVDWLVCWLDVVLSCRQQIGKVESVAVINQEGRSTKECIVC